MMPFEFLAAAAELAYYYAARYCSKCGGIVLLSWKTTMGFWICSYKNGGLLKL
jgi:hypothetical protein